jgi:hypothetical protein
MYRPVKVSTPISLPDKRNVFSAEDGFIVTGPTVERKLTWVRGDRSGNTYRLDDPPMEGWLCPAMFKHFDEAPAELYVKAEPRR